MKPARSSGLGGLGFPIGLLVAMLLFPQEARADIYAPFVWPIACSSIALLPIITLAEGLLLWKLCRLPAWRALRLSFLVNLASTLLGVLLAVLLTPVPVPLLDITMVSVFFAGTVWFEGLLLARFARTIPRPYSLSLRMNIVSYIFLLGCAGYLAHREYLEKQDMRVPGRSPATSKVIVVPPPNSDGGGEDAMLVHR